MKDKDSVDMWKNATFDTLKTQTIFQGPYMHPGSWLQLVHFTGMTLAIHYSWQLSAFLRRWAFYGKINMSGSCLTGSEFKMHSREYKTDLQNKTCLQICYSNFILVN